MSFPPSLEPGVTCARYPRELNKSAIKYSKFHGLVLSEYSRFYGSLKYFMRISSSGTSGALSIIPNPKTMTNEMIAQIIQFTSV